jgi:V/A-type H+-transporting ATPase subunit I
MIHIALSFARYLPRNYSHIGWIAVLFGAYLYFPNYLKATSLLYYVFGIPPQVGATEGLYLMLGGLTAAVAIGIITSGIAGLLELVNVIQVFADVMSYLRLYALGLAGTIVSQTINEISASVPFVVAVVLLVIAHAVNMALGIIGGVIHGLRLNFLEWYHYSFEGGGKLFRPLKLEQIE